MDTFVELSLIIILAAGVAGVMRLLRQPLIIGYIITGILVGPQVLNLVRSGSSIGALSQFGVAILLFIVGLGLSPKVLKDVGKTALFMGFGQVAITFLLAFGLAAFTGFSTTESVYVSLALTFGSTIIVLKLLSDQKDLEKIYGRIAVGILLVQDVVAILVLMIVSSFSSTSPAILILLKGIIFTILLGAVSIYVLPRLATFFARSQEYLFLFSIGWGLGLAALFKAVGLSVEIGALVAGVTLSMSPYSREMMAKLKPLRDFFLILFFVYLGSNMFISGLSGISFLILVFAAFVLLAHPLIVMILSGVFNYGKKIGFLTGISLTQVSEFSFVLLLLGINLGHVSKETLSVFTAVALFTIAISTYFIKHSDLLYMRLSKYLGIFERRRKVKEVDILGSYDVILFGCNRVGYDFLDVFKHLGQGFLVVDFDPDVIKLLEVDGYNFRYGDAEDGEFLDDLYLDKAKMVISTIPDYDTNAFLISKARAANPLAIIIAISHDVDDALLLYNLGASYIVLPHFVGGHFAATMSAKHGFNTKSFEKERANHIAYLEKRKQLGHTHPRM